MGDPNHTSSPDGRPDDDSHDTDDRELLRRVRKLLDKAERTENVHEAEAFALKAAELIARHRIDPDHLARLDEGGSDILEVREFPLGRGAYVRARLSLLMAVAEPHDVRVVFAAGPTGTIAYAAGHRSDLDLAEVLYHSLHQQAASRMNRIHRPTGPATMRYRRSFLLGYARRIGEILADARAEATAPVGGPAAVPALVERAARVDHFAEQRWGRIRSARPARSAQPGGWLDGAAAAERADVGRPRLPGRRSLGRGAGS